jgi:hypothetical protein
LGWRHVVALIGFEGARQSGERVQHPPANPRDGYLAADDAEIESGAHAAGYWLRQ